MAVFVLLTFNDDTKAKQFVESILDQSIEPLDVGELAVESKVRAVFKKPTLICTCGNNKEYTRGKKYGWWVCAKCGKPNEHWAKGHMTWAATHGTNLLPQSLAAPEKRPQGWESPAQWYDLLELLNQEENAE